MQKCFTYILVKKHCYNYAKYLQKLEFLFAIWKRTNTRRVTYSLFLNGKSSKSVKSVFSSEIGRLFSYTAHCGSKDLHESISSD